MWEKHPGVLCLCPPPNQKGQRKEQSHCEECWRGESSCRELLVLMDGWEPALSFPGARGTGIGSCRALETLCCSAHQGLLQDAALPGVTPDLSPANSSDVAVQTLLWESPEAARQRYCSCLSNLQSCWAWWRRRIFLSDIWGYKGSPTLAHWEKEPLEKCCRCSNWCQWDSPCLLSPAGVCPSCEGHQAFCTAPKSLVLPVPPCPVSRHGHMALLSEQQWLPVHLPVCVSGCLSVCLSVWPQQQAGWATALCSRIQACQVLRMAFLPCLILLLVCSFIKICSSSRNKRNRGGVSVWVHCAAGLQAQQPHSPRLREITREGPGMCIWQHFVSWPFHCFLCIWASQSFGHGGPFNLGNRYPLQRKNIQEKLRMFVKKWLLLEKVVRHVILGSAQPQQQEDANFILKYRKVLL